MSVLDFIANGDVAFWCSMDGIAEDVYAMQIPYDTHPVETDIAATS